MNLINVYLNIYYVWDLYILYMGGCTKVSPLAESESPWKPTFSRITGSRG